MAAKPGERARHAEGLSRLRRITISRTIALMVIAVVIATLTPARFLPYFYTLVALFALIGWINYWLAVRGVGGAWRDYASVVADFALLTFTLLYPPPGSIEEFNPIFSLRFDNFDYFYVILAGNAISLRPKLLLWCGACGAAFWSFGVWWLIETFDGTIAEGDDGEDRVEAILRAAADPSSVDIGVQAQGVVVFLITSVLLAVGVAASQRLFERQVAETRRAANLARYLPAEAVETLAARDDPFGAETQTEATILFTDIVSFSRFAEAHPPHDVISLLREVHGVVASEVFAHGGMLDKFIGDGAMATFGAAGDGEAGDGEAGDRKTGAEHAADAIRCAASILRAVEALNERRSGPPVKVGVGVHHGSVVVGDVGSERRMELAVIGDAVNVAARLETMTRELGVGAAISGETIRAAGDPHGCRHLGPKSVKGREEPVDVWAIDGEA